jgi:capsular exopolysaccharide synthesis family protein
MKLRLALAIFTRRTGSIVLLLVLGLLGGTVTLLTATPRYDATATVLLAVRPAGTPYEALSGSVYATTRITSYAEVARSPAVLTPVILELGLDLTADELAERVSPEVDVEGLMIDLVVASRFATEASDIANAVARQLSQVVEQQLDRNSTTNGSVLDVTIVREAIPPVDVAYPLPLPTLGLGFLAGLLMAVGVTLLREVGERAVRSVAELGEISDLPVLGRIGFDSRHDGAGPILDSPNGSEHAREFEITRTAVRYARFESRRNSTLVTSSDRGSGATTVAVALGMTTAAAGHRTVLVDAHLAAPALAAAVGLNPVSGVTDVVVRRYDHSDFVHPVPGSPNLWMIGAGDHVPNPHDILASPRFALLITQLEHEFDEVIIDSAPIGETLQSATVAELVGSTVLVVGIGTSSRAHVSRAVRALHSITTPIAGLVVNRLRSRGRDEGNRAATLERQVA